MKKKLIIVSLIVISLMSSVQLMQGQVILSLLFGDKLNSGKLEFGLNGGFNLSNIRGIDEAHGKNNWMLGFYFDIHLKEETPWYIGTGVYVKSNVGATNIPLDYPGNRPINDTIFTVFDDFDGTVEKNFNTFYVPITLRYLSKIGIFVDAGVQMGLVFKTNDIYNVKVDGYELKYEAKENIYENGIYSWFDAGLNGGIGYKFKKGLGIKIGVWYYYGLTNIYRSDIGLDAYNQSLYVLATIPIGKGKAELDRAEEAAKGQN